MGLMLLTTRPTDIVDGLQDSRINVTVVLRSGLTTDIRRGGDNRLLKTITEFFRERLIRNPNANAAIRRNEVLSQIDRPIQHQRRRLRSIKHPGTVLFCLTESADGAAGQTGRTVPECLMSC